MAIIIRHRKHRQQSTHQLWENKVKLYDSAWVLKHYFKKLYQSDFNQKVLKGKKKKKENPYFVFLGCKIKIKKKRERKLNGLFTTLSTLKLFETLCPL